MHFKIRIKTITPLWTGDTKTGKMDRIHEASILSSLRWWHDAIVRGLGGKVRDTTIATRVVSDETRPAWNGDPIRVSYFDSIDASWVFPGRAGSFTIQIDGPEGECRSALSTLRFAEKYGGLGDLQCRGYGIFRIEDISGGLHPRVWDVFGNIATISGPCQQDLRKFDFLKFNFLPRRQSWWWNVPGLTRLSRDRAGGAALSELADTGMMPVSHQIEHSVRSGKSWSSHAIPRSFFGGGERFAASWAYREPDSGMWEIRCWYRDISHSSELLAAVGGLNHVSGWLKALGVSSEISRAQLLRPLSAKRVKTAEEIANFLNE